MRSHGLKAGARRWEVVTPAADDDATALTDKTRSTAACTSSGDAEIAAPRRSRSVSS
jgi:hypothetical protein